MAVPTAIKSMKNRRHIPEQVVRKLREADRMLGEGQELAEVVKALEVSEATYHRWRALAGGEIVVQHAGREAAAAPSRRRRRRSGSQAASGFVRAPGEAVAMSIETPEELDGLKAVGRVVANAIRAVRRSVGPGVTTAELDRIGAAVFRRAGVRSGPQLDYGFPGVNYISVNDEAVHGIPGPRRLRDGDLVKLDVTAELDGFYAE